MIRKIRFVCYHDWLIGHVPQSHVAAHIRERVPQQITVLGEEDGLALEVPPAPDRVASAKRFGKRRGDRFATQRRVTAMGRRFEIDDL